MTYFQAVRLLHFYGYSHVRPRTGLDAELVERVFEDIERKRRAAEYLHAPPLLVGDG